MSKITSAIGSRPVRESRGPSHPWLAPWVLVPVLLAAGLAGFLVWAMWFELDHTVRAEGQVIPSARTQVIQAADGGVLHQLLVQEGETVVKGQTLALLEKQRADAGFEQSRSRVAALSAALARAKAEAHESPLVFDEALLEGYPEFVELQTQLFEQNHRGRQDEEETLRIILGIAHEELSMTQALFEMGDASRLEVIRARRQVSEYQGKMSAQKNTYRREILKEMAELEIDLDVARQTLSERLNVLKHTEIVTPVAGIVKYLRVNTIGGVLRPGDELMQISPTLGDLILEVKVNPADIGILHLGMPVYIKLSSFDASIYGSLTGTLSYLSSDTLLEETADGTLTFYRAQVTIDQAAKADNLKFANVDLKPGMTGTVDILAGKRTVLHYLVKPISRAFSGALNEG